jgi:hypothetical protein
MNCPPNYRTPTYPTLKSRIKWGAISWLKTHFGQRRGSPKIFCIGWEKTGTTTFGDCMRLLGYSHMTHAPYFSERVEKDDLSAVLRAASLRQSFDDWPWYQLYPQLDRAFPGSRFVLTSRPSEKWVKSLLNHMANRPAPDDWMRRHKRFLYGFEFYGATEDALIARYERHNSEVRRYFSNRPGDFVELDWTNGAGWAELCGFLGVKPPSIPLPHSNRGVYKQ